MLLWVWIAVVIVALVVLGLAAARLLGRLAGLRRAAVRLQRRQADVVELQGGAAALEETMLGLQQRAETMQERLAALSLNAKRK